MAKRALLLIILLTVFCVPAFAQYTGGGGGGAASARSDLTITSTPKENKPAVIETIPLKTPAQPDPVPSTKICFICPPLFIILALLMGAGILLAVARKKK